MEPQSKKTMRHFYCRDVLWETFEQMANDFDCSIDYLINEAMRSYAKTKNYPSSPAQSSSQVPQQSGQPAMQAAPAAAARPSSMPPSAPPPRITSGAMAAGAMPPPPL